MGRLRKKRMHVNNKSIKKKYRTKRRTKDLDQIQDDMEPENSLKLTNQERDQDLPGEGQHYCLHCARYFINEEALKKHFKSKLHKRRLSALREPVYTQKEAEMAAGMGSYILPPPPLDTGMRIDSNHSMGMSTGNMVDLEGPNEIEVNITNSTRRTPNENDINEMISLDKQLTTLQV